MAIIVISRQIGTFGNEIADGVAETLHYQMLTKELITQMLQESGFVEEQSLDTMSIEKKPSFLSGFNVDRDRFLCYTKKVMYEFALRKNVVMMDMGGQLLFQDFPNTLRARMVAPLDVRIKRIQAERSCDERYANYLINESDQARAGFNKYFFNIDWEDINLYDLLISTSAISPQGAIRLIAEEVPDIEKEEQQDGLTHKLKELVLRQSVLINILYKEKIVLPYLNVEIHEGLVMLTGFSHSEEDMERCETAVRRVSGVKDVDNQIIVEPTAM